MSKPRYTICTIVTTDEEFVKEIDMIRDKSDYTHEDIYRAGVAYIKNQLNKD